MRLTTIRVDSAFGRWTHTEWRPPHLAAVVAQIWHFEGQTALPRERHFPAAHLEVILHVGPRFRDVDATGKTRDLFPHACLTGMQLSPTVIEAPAGTCCVIGIRLRPIGAYTLLGRPAALSNGATLDLSDVLGVEITELTERCQFARSVEERFAAIERWITARLARAHDAHPAVAWVTQRLEQTDGREPIATLRAYTGLGNARLVDTFRQQMGTTPKRYARVLRFQRALTLLQTGGALVDAAMAAGFYDQPHMNADFREFAGMTPVQFVGAMRYPNATSLAEPA
jgi:methylphosphotriester-DNA--protein-cysteine methyltransferase